MTVRLKQGTIEVRRHEDRVVLEVASEVSLPIKRGEDAVETSPFKGTVSLSQQQALMLYLSAHGIPESFRLKVGSVELSTNFADRFFRLRFTDYSSSSRTLYVLSSQALLDFLFLLKRALPRPVHFFYHPHAVVDVSEDSLTISTPSGFAELRGEALEKLRFFLSKVVEGPEGRFSFGLEGLSFGENRLFVAGRSFAVVKNNPFFGKKVNEFLCVLHLLLQL